MLELVQSLEGRTLFAVTTAGLAADLSTVRSDAKTVRADLGTVRKTVAADVKTIQSDLKGLSGTSSNNKLVATLKADDARSLAKVNVAQEKLLTSGQALSTLVAVEGKVLHSHTTNTALRSRLASDITKLNSTVATNLANLQSAVSAAQTQYDTDVQAIAANNPSSTKLGVDVGTARTDFATTTGTYLAAANTFKTDTGTLATDAGSI